MIQPWSSHSCTECNLVTSFNEDLIDYDLLEYEEKLFYHNDVIRIEKIFE